MNTALIISLFAVACGLFATFVSVALALSKKKSQGWSVEIYGRSTVIYRDPKVEVHFGIEFMATGDVELVFYSSQYEVRRPAAGVLSAEALETYRKRVRTYLNAERKSFEEE